MPRIIVNTEVCKGCELCAAACPRKIIGYEKDKINSKGYHPAVLLDEEKCIGCAMCATMCPDCAIIVER
ncbi:indolepyruvate ferredoxin oxidoreductase subunit alpha [Solibaculum mannosilyticum]|uniref:2-oxoacid:acceptor oxidoreductase subunit delta n=1 Tax=Solibaculum mannosilyticum TaxID=2780922 RepID=A0A7I8D0H1_9FIRM|nr:4Fe-4S binding protein [Solibaculum mannosilyticum]MCO7136268.1 4Fe-4S binding protein [[Clostridium] leptum]BCI60267.1 2-oxoacid:acceptor oxidoreductase subunit delta [Solibaculum mannosilyticum]CZT55071.1 2-oxoglutarate-acceptor oxidoreductase subunit OorD [Eubacteriaceae bacterium CHKCI005]